MTKPANAAKTADACECSKYLAMDGEQHTEENLANGDYDSWETGCQATTRNTFAPGHDAKLKSFLIQHGAKGHEIRFGDAVDTAEKWAKTYTFGPMILAGIAKAKAKEEARETRKAKAAERKAAKGKPAERKLAEAAGLVTHDGNAARQEREAKATSLAEIVADEEAAHAEATKRSQPEPEWDDIVAPPEASAEYMALAAADEPKGTPILEDEAAMNTHAREAREEGLVVAKVGRWERQGALSDDGKTFSYRDSKGELKQATKFTIVAS